MKPRTPKPPDWPRARRWLALDHPAWLIMEPARLAPVGGAFFALLAMLYYFFRQWRGAAMAAGDVIVGVGLTFVVAYAATGMFVYYVLRIAEREQLPENMEHRPQESPDTETGPAETEPR